MQQRFKYKAKDATGRTLTGEVEASSDSFAAKLLREKQLVVISISPKTNFSLGSLSERFNKTKKSDVTNFTRQFATMVNAGLPITEALLISRSQSEGAMQATVSQILADVEEGKSFSSALETFPHVFSKTYVSLVKAGEAGGVLDQVLVRLADNLEKDQEFRGKVKGAMIYPIIIVIGMIAVAFVMLVFVVPRLTDLYDQFDSDLPFATRLLINISDTMVLYWPIVLVLLAIGSYGFKVYRNTKKGRRKIDELMLKIPLYGDLSRQIALTELARTFSLMVGSGVSILETLAISSGVVSNKVIADALDDAYVMVEKGFPVSMSFSKHPEAFPYIFTQMMAVGEETGKMDEVLGKIAHVFEVESSQKVKGITAAIEPIILMVLGIGVAFLVISIIMPIYNLTSTF